MSLQSRVSGRLAQLRAAGQLLVAPRSWPGPLAGPPRTRSSAAAPRAQTPAGVGACGAAAVGRRVGVRTWAPLAMAAKVDLSTSTDWKEAKSFLKGLSEKQREEHYFCRDFIRLKKIPTWKETAKGATKVEDPKYKKDKQLNEKISLFRGDITKLEVDAIVNAALSPASESFGSPMPNVCTLGTTSTPLSSRCIQTPLLRLPPLTTLKATNWGFQATHLQPPSYPEQLVEAAFYSRSVHFPPASCASLQPPGTDTLSPGSPGSLVSLHQQKLVPRDFRLCVGNLPPPPLLPVNTLSGRRGQRCAPRPGSQVWLIFTASGSGSY
ncbi:ADP-ribose glycohydrolase MACROD1 isoform X2 [Diceros bicornis minor]|uniref:ADP-ribose glycohydrolase MACROD1 isoform X2 n=1 Tax=Diceros bicornis minor TaxID=77932 RepID=UPI0026EB51BB|nr:ADP-ribose glycohydrolase MACROD1 isoform X2 [Diceros bicornis minor]